MSWSINSVDWFSLLSEIACRQELHKSFDVSCYFEHHKFSNTYDRSTLLDGRSFLSCHWFYSYKLTSNNFSNYFIHVTFPRLNRLHYYLKSVLSSVFGFGNILFGSRPLSLADCVIIRTSLFTHYAKFGKNNETIERISNCVLVFFLHFNRWTEETCKPVQF